MNILLYSLAVVLTYNFFYGWLERWINTGGPYSFNIRIKSDRKWFGLGIPYHLPIMFMLSLSMTIAPLLPEILFNPWLWLIFFANLLLGALTEDWWVQLREWLAGEGWITSSDWSCYWGYIPITGEDCVIPVWYIIYILLAVVLYLCYLC